MNFIDTHSHLYAQEFNTDRSSLISDAINNGIQKIFLPNIDAESIAALFRLSEEYPEHCFPLMGVHPCSVTNKYTDELKTAEHWLGKKKFYGIGETGIDLYWDKTYYNQQCDALETQIKWAIEMELPIILHTRDSFYETFKIIEKHNCEKLTGIFHCFTGSAEEAEKVVSLGGFKMGIGGVLTFKNSTLASVIKNIDLRHIVLETDSPYLAPVPFRGKRNDPAYLIKTAEKLAEIKNIPLIEVAETTTANATQIFKLSNEKN